MDTKDKLKLIQQFSGFTQTELAHHLKVSFPTLNSWINGKSMPRTAKLGAIDTLYTQYTGQKKIPDDTFSAKKQIIHRKAKEHKNIIAFIKNRSDLYNHLILSFTYNTNSIEGSTLTENETADILFEGATIRNKDLVEHLEAKNHQAALNYLFKEVTQDCRITESFVLKLHEILMNNIRDDAGVYRTHGVRIVGSHVPTANHLSISDLMKDLVKTINAPNSEIVAHVSQVHAKFEKIHPFSDGNGRVGRLIMAAMLLRKSVAPAVIKKKRKQDYYKCLQRAQLRGEYELLEEFICDAILNGFDILQI